MEKLNFKIANIVISTNQSYKSIAVTRGGKNKFDVFVVRNGPDLNKIKFMPPKNELKNGFDYLVAYVGVIGIQDGIDNLLHSIDYIVHKTKHKNIKFILIGKGPNWQVMVNLCHRMKLSEYVEFTGFLSYEKLYEILATADLCVNPEFRNSFTDKSTMLKIMDYMTFGKAIIQFYTKEGNVTAGDAAEYVYENDVIAFAEKVISLLNDKGKRKEMGAIGKQRIMNALCWEKQKPDLFKAYRYIDSLNQRISTDSQ